MHRAEDPVPTLAQRTCEHDTVYTAALHPPNPTNQPRSGRPFMCGARPLPPAFSRPADRPCVLRGGVRSGLVASSRLKHQQQKWRRCGSPPCAVVTLSLAAFFPALVCAVRCGAADGCVPGAAARVRRRSTTTSSSLCSSATPASENLACSCALLMTPTPRATSARSALTLYAAAARTSPQLASARCYSCRILGTPRACAHARQGGERMIGAAERRRSGCRARGLRRGQRSRRAGRWREGGASRLCV